VSGDRNDDLGRTVRFVPDHALGLTGAAEVDPVPVAPAPAPAPVAPVDPVPASVPAGDDDDSTGPPSTSPFASPPSTFA